VEQNLCPEDRTSLIDLMILLESMLPFKPTLIAMRNGGPFAPAPVDRVDRSNEMIIRKLTGLEKGLYTGMCDNTNFHANYPFVRMLTAHFWKTVWANIDIQCPHGIAIRSDYQIVYLHAGSKRRGLSSDKTDAGITWHLHPSIPAIDLDAVAELAITAPPPKED